MLLDTPCKLWGGKTYANGYGYIPRRGLAHRVAWIERHGPVPRGYEVCHKCDVRNCWNVDHLFLGTRKDNLQDAARKDRMHRPRGVLCGRAKLTEEQVREIRMRRAEGCRPLGRYFGVSHSRISEILRGLAYVNVEDV